MAQEVGKFVSPTHALLKQINYKLLLQFFNIVSTDLRKPCGQ